MIFVFDLDGTIVDTSHRYRDLPCGKIDLDFWFANSTEEMVAKDTLLPLADVWRTRYAEGHEIVVCTARDFTPSEKVALVDPGATYRKFLADNDLRYHSLLHRTMAGPDHLSMSDGDLKTRLLNDWATATDKPKNWRDNAIMFDDNMTVIKQMLIDGLHCENAIRANKRLAA